MGRPSKYVERQNLTIRMQMRRAHAAKVGEPLGGALPAFCLFHFQPDSSGSACHPGDGIRDHRSCLGNRGASGLILACDSIYPGIQF